MKKILNLFLCLAMVFSCLHLNVKASQVSDDANVYQIYPIPQNITYDGSSMKQIDAQDVLDIAMSGTSATLQLSNSRLTIGFILSPKYTYLPYPQDEGGTQAGIY
mgnify:CR=1 FL=1